MIDQILNSKKYSVLLFIFLGFLFCCKKKESLILPVTIADSTWKITSVTIQDINDVEVSYQIKPPVGETYSHAYLHWSSSNDFSSDHDSVNISNTITGVVDGNYLVKGLKQSTKYYARLTVAYKNKQFFSTIEEWVTGTLKIISAFGLDTLPLHVNRNFDQNSLIWTNFDLASGNNQNHPTKLFLGNYECPITNDVGQHIFFHIPVTIPPGRYALRLERKGLTAQTPDSIYVLKGIWSELTPPDFPLAFGYDNAIGYYGSCFSNDKGYIIPGLFYHDYPVGHPDFPLPKFILEFDASTRQWTRRYPANPIGFENPICYYHNNAIYVIGGKLLHVYSPNGGRIQKMMKLDLNTWIWSELDSLPFQTIQNLVSFELNNEWYIGLGADAANLSLCCGDALPSKKFWKYNPQTNKWTALADFPGNHAHNQFYPTGFTIGTKGYVYFGALPVERYVPSMTDFKRELWEYNVTSNTWAQKILPINGGPPIGEKYQIVSYKEKAYFLTTQRLELFGLSGYNFMLYLPCLEYDPVTNTFQRITNSNTAGVMKLIYKKDNEFYFQADALGYIYNIPNRTNKLVIEQ